MFTMQKDGIMGLSRCEKFDDTCCSFNTLPASDTDRRTDGRTDSIGTADGRKIGCNSSFIAIVILYSLISPSRPFFKVVEGHRNQRS